MYFFDKKIIYLIWKMHEGQARGVGTVRFLAMDDVCRIEVTITGCGKIQGTYPVYVLSGDMQSLLGEIVLNKGKGNLFLRCQTSALGHLSFPYTQVTGLHIDLKTEGCLEQRWLPMQEQAAESRVMVKKQAVEEAAKQTVEEAVKQIVEEEAEQIIERPVSILEPDVEENETKTIEKTEKIESKKEEKKKKDVKPPKKEEFQLYPNKWKQLCAIYPIVHPFGDGRAYLSIEPRDFVVLQERYQPMVQNSFLLHGFYHYRHLLLGRQRQGNHVQYYLGVPGVFYEKEKAAALFYGFESFEGAVTPASEGNFGYYMKRVQL